MVQAFESVWAFKASTAEPSTTSFATAALRFAPTSDTVKANREKLTPTAVLGYRGSVHNNTRVSKVEASGTLTFELTLTIWEYFLPYMMGGGASTPWTPNAAYAGAGFDYMRDDAATVYLYKNCHVTGWRLKATSGGFIMLEIDVHARNEIVTGVTASEGETGQDAQAMPALDLPVADIADEPLIAAEAAVAFGGTDYNSDDWELSMDHGATPIFRHSILRTNLLAGRRKTMFKSSTEWNVTNENIFYLSTVGGIAATLTFTRAATSSVITLTTVVLNDDAPNISGDSEVLYGIDGEVKGNLPTSSANEISIISDSTP